MIAQADQQIYGLKKQMQNTREQFDKAVAKKKGFEDSLNELLAKTEVDMTVPT
jgi:hypothetical protein